MLVKIKNMILAVTVMFGLSFMFVPSVTFAQNSTKVCEGVTLTGAGCDDQASQVAVEGIVTVIINILSLIVGVVSVIMIIVGGFNYVLSGGDSTKVGNAKNTILYAIVGLVIVALAQAIVVFVLNNVDPTTAPPAGP
jgi:hypothetical protein